METLKKVGSFGVLDLTLSISDDGILRLDVALNGDDATGFGVFQATNEIITREDFQLMLEGVEMFNTLPSGLGRLWQFRFLGGYVVTKEGTYVPEFVFNIELVMVKKEMGYSRIRRDPFTPNYRGVVAPWTIDRRINAQPIVCDNAEEGDDVSPGKTDLVEYFRERNPTNAYLYCPQVFDPES